MPPTHQHTPHHGESGHHPGHNSDRGQAEILDLDAEVLAEHIASITAWLPLKSEPRQIVDLGCGTGAGTFALLERFPDAHVTAVDTSAGHLQLLREKARARSSEGSIRTVQADLDADHWPDLGTPDLVWASASMHHMANPDRALTSVHELLAPGGLFAVVELAGFPRFLPAGAPESQPGLEERAHAATDSFHAEHVPHRGADWGPILTAAGFTVEDERTITVNIEGARSEAIGRYAYGSLQRIRGVAAPALSPEDLAALDELLDTSSPNSLLHREDLAVRTERTVWAARRA
ncbi:SAM-dependent methyltransferase [Streptomyces sp. SAI-208]|jgi:SAM-dependent methyltransferase|uniref:Methyltransferase domain-containing protein n=2 Tax=Streptomyces TaxID=1883 RepID=A0ABU4JZ23_9ACTN|nr:MULTISPECIES: class I SAM-dependent methyltransferase [Streptomyces]MDH6546018.1 SAM-dependent methyltransferase [Streptomyces sp. SAI-041]MDH6570802.1 SAM-dependent methyltransferase [Streptomyces sp. SAI-117]MDH6589955.1 SAM-dependent methyltransferase [Streptomyces sp. SAI-133]MDH6611804.1 SAM-dependent methyltransferase [Streptomyces sp. SAI-208]MDX2290744.1 methyltransferase domain-containing protein [Streptomyces roseolus]